ncbi:MAG: TetR/AcrR family transcriptional regulator, partial [Perlucidibaca sp.]
TNHIATEANVDIASLYQYFNHKEELIEAWLEHLANQLIVLAGRYLEKLDLRRASVREIAQGALQLGLSALRADPVVMELARHWQHLSIHRPMMILERELLRVAAIYFRQQFQRYPIEDLHIRLYVLANSTMATVGRHLSEDRPVIRDEELIDTLVDMIVLMLEHGADGARSADPPASAPGPDWQTPRPPGHGHPCRGSPASAPCADRRN